MHKIRQPAVSGLFYPADSAELHMQLQQYLGAAHPVAEAGPPKAIIAPHAGYIYSGPIAASAYARLKAAAADISRVVILAPSHRLPFGGLAYPSDGWFRTPLGDVAVDREALEQVADLPQVRELDRAFDGEHALEVQLPFLQEMLQEFRIVPFIVGDALADDVAAVLERLWGGDETLIVISSDLSHYLDYQSACSRDAGTSRAIEQLNPAAIGHHDACGRNPLNGLLLAARAHGLHAETVDLRNSGDTAGSPERVVGYGAYVFH